MGFLKKQRQAIKKIEEDKIRNFLDEINEVSKKHKLVLVPTIGKYRASFEVQDLPEESSKNNLEIKNVGEEESKNSD